MFTYTLYNEEGYFVTSVEANSPEEAITLLGVDNSIEVVDIDGIILSH